MRRVDLYQLLEVHPGFFGPAAEEVVIPGVVEKCGRSTASLHLPIVRLGFVALSFAVQACRLLHRRWGIAAEGRQAQPRQPRSYINQNSNRRPSCDRRSEGIRQLIVALPEQAALHVGVRIGPCHIVQGVEHVYAQLKAILLSDRSPLYYRGVQVQKAGVGQSRILPGIGAGRVVR